MVPGSHLGDIFWFVLLGTTRFLGNLVRLRLACQKLTNFRTKVRLEVRFLFWNFFRPPLGQNFD